jgi:hypothetical protein
VATRDVFSADELAQLRGFPEIGRAELIRFFMLTPADEEFIRGFRDRKNMLGAAVQLCTLPWLGFVPDDVPAAAVARLSERLGIPVGELRGYGAREQTRTGHLREVAAHLGWHQVDGPRWKDLAEFLFARALEHDSPKLLFRLACEYLSSSRLIRPGVVHVLQRVATARKRARGETWQRVEPMLTGFLRGELDGMLAPEPLLGRTRLAWLGTGPTSSAPAAVKGELEKLAYLRGMDAHTLDLSVLPAERRRFLAGLGRRLTAQNLARRDDDRRYPILLTLAAQSAVDVLDEVLLMFDQALSGREAAAREKLTEVLAERARTGEDRQALLDDILAIVLDPGVTDDQVGGRLRRDVGHDRMRAAHEARRERLPRDHGHLAMMDASMSYLRQFVPDVLAAVDFAGGPGMDDLLQAVGILGRPARKKGHLVGKKPTAADALALANDELHAALADLEAQLARGGGKGEVRLGKDGELIIPPLTAEDGGHRAARRTGRDAAPRPDRVGAGRDRRPDRVHRPADPRGRHDGAPAGPAAQPAVRPDRRGHQHGPVRDVGIVRRLLRHAGVDGRVVPHRGGTRGGQRRDRQLPPPAADDPVVRHRHPVVVRRAEVPGSRASR